MQRLRPARGGNGRVVTGVPGAIGIRAQEALAGAGRAPAGSGAAAAIAGMTASAARLQQSKRRSRANPGGAGGSVGQADITICLVSGD